MTTPHMLRAYQIAYPGSTAIAIPPLTLATLLDQSCFVLDLQIALEDHKNGGGTFWRTEEGAFVAESWDEGDIHFAPTKPELLMKIVEVMP
jgi:hypothetical protein